MAKHKTIPVTQTIREALGEIGELEDLHTEMETWQENLENNSMEQLPKYEEVQEAVNVLENGSELVQAAEQLSRELDEYVVLCGECEAPTPLLDVEIEYTLMESYKGRSDPRWMRLANSTAPHRAVVDFLGGDLDGEVTRASTTKQKVHAAAHDLFTLLYDEFEDKHADLRDELKKLKLDNAPKEDDEEEKEIEIDCSELENWCDELDAVEFPGMY